jgi:IclR family transcriptional regulator, acetate operon repressor
MPVRSAESSTGAARVLAVLRFVAEHPKGCRLAQIAGAMGAPKSSVHRALAGLVAAGFVRQGSDGLYHLGYDFLRLAFSYHEEFAPHLAVAPLLQRLASELGEAAHYGVLVGSSIVYQAKVAPSHATIRMTSVVGGSNPAYRTGLGKALLMHALPDRAAVQTFARAHGPLERRTPNTLVTVDALHRALADSRTRGYALDLEENEIGVGCIAIPVFLDSTVVPTGAVSVSAVTSRTPVARLVEQIDGIRAIIAEELGDVLHAMGEFPS